MTKNSLVAGNWKMNCTVPEALKLLASIEHNLKTPPDHVDVVLIPPFTALYSVGISIQDSTLNLGAQDIFWEDSGAYTGEISGTFLKDVGCSYVLIGHSDRRKCFGETNETINKKVLAALRNEITPIVCVGETADEREAHRQEAVVETQIKNGLFGIHTRDAENILIAYEPVWAIGTGKNATPAQAQEMHHFIKNLIEKVFDAPTARKIRILYGGSVNPSNCADLLVQKDIDGLLVGGTSLNGSDFVDIIRAVPPKNM